MSDRMRWKTDGQGSLMTGEDIYETADAATAEVIASEHNELLDALEEARGLLVRWIDRINDPRPLLWPLMDNTRAFLAKEDDNG